MVIDDLQMALKQFESIYSPNLCNKAKEILVLLRNMLREAIINNFEVYIAKVELFKLKKVLTEWENIFIESIEGENLDISL